MPGIVGRRRHGARARKGAVRPRIVGLVVLSLAGMTVLAGAMPSFAADTTLYVDRASGACSDSGSGTLAQPFCTIGAAAAKVLPGQTVQVAAATYPEAVTVTGSGTSTAPITFTAAPGATVTLTGQANGFAISGRSWITITGFAVTRTTGYAIDVSSSSNITISNNDLSFAGAPQSGKTKGGIKLSGVTDSLVSGNASHDNSDYGIYLTAGSTRNEVRNNAVYRNAEGFQRGASGIRLYSAPGNTVDGNVSHDNEDSGIESYTGSNNTLIYNNVTYNNGDHGIDNLQSTGQRIIANTVYNNVTAGINVEGSSTGATLANNISVDNGINSPRTHSNIRIESGSTSGTTMDYDLVNLRTADVMLIWDSISYSSLASFQAATGQESHGIQADPRWKSPATGDLHLTAGSPAIDSANSGVSGQSATDAEGHPRVDDAGTPNTGAGPRAYDDRGAYEFGQTDQPPAAVLSVSPQQGQPPLAVTADASGSTDSDTTPIATYAFAFGDGSPDTGPQPSPTASHTYTSPGTYTVTVTLTDTAGLSSQATATVTVTDAPAARLSVTPSQGVVNLAVTADASASTDTDNSPIATYAFDFGDGTTTNAQTTATAPHTYTRAGAYTVTVTVTDTAGHASTAAAQVSVTDNSPTPALTVTPSSGTAPLSTVADASASRDADGTPIATYAFDFGDGATTGDQAAATAAHTYSQPGTYTAKVTVKDTAGNAATATATVTVATNSPPTASLTVTPANGPAPLAVTADASASTDTDQTPIATYSFNFGDGFTTGDQTAAKATHTYTKTGNYTVTVKVTDTAGLSSTTTKRVKVR
jgi:parallel beta-helix repeat protein